jgi:hypothetical protein
MIATQIMIDLINMQISFILDSLAPTLGDNDLSHSCNNIFKLPACFVFLKDGIF